MKNHIVSAAQFEILNKRNASIMTYHASALDESIISVLRGLFYFHPTKFTTVFSCEGHPGHETWDALYIIFAAIEGGPELLYKLYSDFVRGLAEAEPPEGITISLNQYGLKLTSRQYEFGAEGYQWYPAIVLSTEPIQSDEHRNFILQHLTAAVARLPEKP